MKIYHVYEIRAKSFEGRLPLECQFKMTGMNEEEVRESILTRWPELYDIEIMETQRGGVI